LKPGFFKNEDLARLPFAGRLLYAGLWTLADREGRLEDRPSRLKIELFPYDPVDVDALLAELAAGGFVRRYTVNGWRVIAIPTFLAHQRPHIRELASVLPAPPPRTVEPDQGTTRVLPGFDPGLAGALPRTPDPDPNTDPVPDADPVTDPDPDPDPRSNTVPRLGASNDRLLALVRDAIAQNGVNLADEELLDCVQYHARQYGITLTRRETYELVTMVLGERRRGALRRPARSAG
jgi:hypothetical protein